MPLRRATSQLAARAGIRQVQVVLQADRAAEAVSRVLRAEWTVLLRLIREQHPLTVLPAIRQWTERLPLLLMRQTGKRLGELTDWSARSARWAIKRTVPKSFLLRESSDGNSLYPDSLGAFALDNNTVAHRASSTSSAAPKVPGVLLEGDPPHPFTFTFQDLFAKWRNWQLSPNEDALDLPDVQRGILDILFPPMPSEQVNSIVYRGNWQQRLINSTKLGASPDLLASAVATGLIQGQDWRDVAKRIEPLVQNVESSARRIARTECLRVAGEAQFATHQQLGNLVVGHQIHATLDQNTRPWHRSRDGQVYYLEPKEGQKGMRQCPHPPEEAEDPNERPGNTPFVAPNCRCYLSPVLRPPAKDLAAHPAFGQPSQLAPDPAIWSDWFERAGEHERRIAVGSRRYDAACELSGHERPGYEHFIDATGKLLGHEAMRNEPAGDRRARTQKVKLAMDALRKDKLAVSAFGYLPSQI